MTTKSRVARRTPSGKRSSPRLQAYIPLFLNRSKPRDRVPLVTRKELVEFGGDGSNTSRPARDGYIFRFLSSGVMARRIRIAGKGRLLPTLLAGEFVRVFVRVAFEPHWRYALFLNALHALLAKLASFLLSSNVLLGGFFFMFNTSERGIRRSTQMIFLIS